MPGIKYAVYTVFLLAVFALMFVSARADDPNRQEVPRVGMSGGWLRELAESSGDVTFERAGVKVIIKSHLLLALNISEDETFEVEIIKNNSSDSISIGFYRNGSVMHPVFSEPIEVRVQAEGVWDEVICEGPEGEIPARYDTAGNEVVITISRGGEYIFTSVGADAEGEGFQNTQENIENGGEGQGNPSSTPRGGALSAGAAGDFAAVALIAVLIVIVIKLIVKIPRE
jgi:hypothetical protein